MSSGGDELDLKQRPAERPRSDDPELPTALPPQPGRDLPADEPDIAEPGAPGTPPGDDPEARHRDCAAA